MKIRLLFLAALLTTALACSGLIDTEALIAQGDAAAAEGTAFGASTDLHGCIREGLSRQSTCGEMEVMCLTMNNLWTQGCLDEASPVSGFCEGVPTKESIMETARWRVARCEAEGYGGDKRCPNLLDAVQLYCHDS
ncbi:MAG: hypothetical protein ACI8RZ_000143 [Myxococcota bacterium]|jgi:hypothetical protein